MGHQLGLVAPDPGRFRVHHVNARRHRASILRQLGVRRASERDCSALRTWLVENCRRSCGAGEDQVAAGYAWCLGRSIYVASDKIMERLVRGARHDFLEGLLTSIARELPAHTRAKLEASLCEPMGPTGFHRLKDDVGAASLASVLGACDRVAFVEGLELPTECLEGVDRAWVPLLSRRVEGETASEMRRHGETRPLGLYALYLMDRRCRMIDGLVDLLLEIVHRLQTRSRRKVIGATARDRERVHGKERLLVDIAEAAVDDPRGRVVDVIYPVAGVAKLKAVIEEHRAKGTMDRRIQTVMRGSYASHYRRMLPRLLSVLRFCSNNTGWRPILDALHLIVSLGGEKRRLAPAALAPSGSIPARWKGLVLDGRGQLNVISYELCVLNQLRERVRAREIWVEGADRHRNPDRDLPADFDERRATYYAGLGLEQDARVFVADIRARLDEELRLLNATLLQNDTVRLRASGENRISITPFAPQPEPAGLIDLKSEIGRSWPMTGLLDVLKETALDTQFLDCIERALLQTSAGMVNCPA